MAKGRQRTSGERPGGTSTSLAMKEAWARFDGGDKLLARRLAKEILASGPPESEAAEAKDLLDRTRVPGLAVGVAIVLGAVTAALILLAVLRY